MSSRSINTALRKFSETCTALKRLDETNQRNLSHSKTKAKIGQLTKKQLELLTEGVFLSSYRAFELFINDSFILYLMGKPSLSSRIADRYFYPASFRHAYDTLKGQQRFLSWNSPESIVDRAESYFKGGWTFSSSLKARNESLLDLTRIRNYIAHDSAESKSKYNIVLRKHYTIFPLVAVPAGRYLLLPMRGNVGTYYLLEYIDLMLQTAREIAEA